MVSNSKKNNVDEVVFGGISSVVERHLYGTNATAWVGTMTNLSTALNRNLSKKQRKVLPGSPSALRVVINRVINRLRNRGIGVRFGRTSDHMRTRFVKFVL